MIDATSLRDVRRSRTSAVLAWIFCGFVAIVGLGFGLDAYWLSSAVAALLTVFALPSVGRWLGSRFTSSVAAITVRSVAVFAGLSLLVAVSEYERGERRAEYLENRAAILAQARKNLERHRADRLAALVSRYRFVATPRLDRYEAVLAKRRERAAASDDAPEQKSRRERKIDDMVEQALERTD